jgi:hypothetical protein
MKDYVLRYMEVELKDDVKQTQSLYSKTEESTPGRSIIKRKKIRFLYKLDL